ncbi:MAG: hypothetical protein KGH88_07020 [Thaumarchaeota archaeon]|nr:hypothetical protein [Nitrososphaerota archaeon]
MRRYFIVGIAILMVALGIFSIATPDAFAHRSGCHRWHSCPSDTGSYVCGDTGYCSQCPDNSYCKAGQPILGLDTSSYPSSGISDTNTSSNIASSVPNYPTQAVTASPAQVSVPMIPQWIKNNAKWWSEDQVGDSDFVKGIQYLVQNGIIQIPQTQSSSNSGSLQIPQWIKNTAGWWADGAIDDSEFLKGIEYLVQAGIIQVNAVQQENQTGNTPSQSDETSQDTMQTTAFLPTTCHAINDTLPDPNCTPGAVDPRVTQDNIDSTICVPGYTKTIRPPVSYTEPLKFKLMDAYGYTDSPSNYELDHLIPLELGGSPTDVRNLWPEPHSNSYTKDGLENYLHEQVCSGDMSLQEAQNDIATNWYHYWEVSKN